MNPQSNDQAGSVPLTVETIELLGGWLCLDFVNTVDPRVGAHSRDFLTNYADLVLWSHHVGVLTEARRGYLLHAGAQHTVEASKIFARAIVLRETLYRVFSAIAGATTPERADLDVLQAEFAEAMQHASLVPTTEGFATAWLKNEDALDCILWPIATSAVELLTSNRIRRVKQCPGVGDCGWLFLDISKNGSRLWCSMNDCGSRAKMRRQYARKRAAR